MAERVESQKRQGVDRGAGQAQVWLYMIMHACDVEMNAEVDALVGMVKVPANPN